MLPKQDAANNAKDVRNHILYAFGSKMVQIKMHISVIKNINLLTNFIIS